MHEEVPRPTLILLPGMHGTAALWSRFLAALPPEQPWRTIAYPPDQCLDYDRLLALIEREVSDLSSMVVIGESFSGPLALRLAAAHPDRVRAAILTGSFVRPPYWRWLQIICRPLLFRMPLPRFLVRYAVAGREASDVYVDQVKQAIREPAPAVLAYRARCVLAIDAVEALQKARQVICIVPTHDHMVRRWALKPIVAARPETKMIEIDGPHLILQANPAAAWQVIESALAGR